MKILTVVGARPQFIKASMVSSIIRKNHTEILVHTGQHYDYNMSDVFFEQLRIPKPDYNLNISGGSHANMTARMMMSLEETMIKEKPNLVLVYGDTNSTLAASISAAKLLIPICHVEAGNRTGSKTNPEEINRVCTDHVSSLLLACTESGLNCLKKENLSGISYLVGDPMYDAFLQNIKNKSIIKLVSLYDNSVLPMPDKYYYLTCHREENTKDDNNLLEILLAADSLDYPSVYPVHPRNKERALRICQNNGIKNVMLVEPVGYLESIRLVNNSMGVITDSGGVQREAFFAEKKCVTVLDFICWPETMVDNRNVLSKPNKQEIIDKLKVAQHIDKAYKPFGNGNAGNKICERIDNFFR